MKNLILISLFSVLLGCASLQANQLKPTAIVNLNTTVPAEFQSKLAQKDKIFLQLGIISGAVYGYKSAPVWVLDLYDASNPKIDIIGLSAYASKYAQPFSNKKGFPGSVSNLVMSPAGTKTLRISADGIDVTTRTSFLGGLKNTQGETVMLQYFDRPCTLTGEVRFPNGDIAEHYIKVDNPGIYFLTVKKFGNKSLITAEKSSDSLLISLNKA